jgi:uncharacterized protein with ParB-like and HNH nuclease domain
MPDIIDTPRINDLEQIFNRIDLQYRVPLYQRDYEWGDEQVDDFSDDVLRLGSENEEFFFGTIVLSDSAPGPAYDGEHRVKYIIDGQQRLISSLLLLAAIRHFFLEIGKNETSGITNAAGLCKFLFLGELEDHSQQQPKISANRINQLFLSKLLTEATESEESVNQAFKGLDKNTQERSQKIYYAYKRFRGQITKRILKKMDIEFEDVSIFDMPLLADKLESHEQRRAGIEMLKKIVINIRKNIKIVEINIPDWKNAFLAFEGLNNRGLELSEKDLIKNFVLSKTSEAQMTNEFFQKLEEKWLNIVSRIAESKFANFLRHYLLLTFEEVPIKKVVRILISSFENDDSSLILDKLDKASLEYEKITKPSKEINKKIALRLSNLITLGAVRCYPIPLALKLNNARPADEEKILKAVEVLYFRRSAIMQKDNKAIEDDFREIAVKIYNSSKDEIIDSLSSIRDITPSDDDFKEAFKRKRDMKPAIAKYALLELESSYIPRQQLNRKVHEASLEHIMPKNPTRWNLSKDDKERFTLLLNRIGNLTLLSQSGNSGISNKKFKAKLVLYKKDNLHINKYIISCAAWREKQIEERQIELANQAVLAWQR